MSDALLFQVETVVHELVSGHALAYPLADPSLAVYGDPDRVLDELTRGLALHLKSVPASRLGPYFQPGGDIEWVSVRLSRGRHGRLAERFLTFDIPCLVLTESRGSWIRVLVPGPALSGLTFYLDRDESLQERLNDELRRALSAFGDRAELLLEPASQLDVRLVTLDVEARRGFGADGSLDRESAAERRRRVRTVHDVKLLKSVGVFVDVERLRHLETWMPREADEQRLAALFSGKRRLSALVVGEPGVGKSALIRRLALLDKRVLVTSGTRLVAGQSMVGQLEQRVLDVLSAAERLDAVIYFDTLDELLGDREGGTNLAGLLRPWMEQERVRLVAEITPGRHDVLARRQVGFFSLLHKIEPAPWGVDETCRLLMLRSEVKDMPKWRRRRLDSKARPLRPPARFADDEAASVLVELARRYFPYGKLPGQALRLADELAAMQAGPDSQRRGAVIASAEPVLDVEGIHRGLSRISGIPEMLLRSDTPLKLERLRQGLQRSLIGQLEAVELLAAGLCAVKARLQPEGRPLAVLLFVGPTGVGKTQAARALAQLLYGSADRLIRFDMSEYADPSSADRLIRGTDRDEGLLTRRIRREPFSLLLLDEIEKADDGVFDLLLQVFGEGRLSDAKGRPTYFHNCLIILTSNLGAARRRVSKTGFGAAGSLSSRTFYDEEVQKRFRPELVNRLDKVVPFEPLTLEEACRVTALQVEALAGRRGFDERGLTLQVEESVIEELARRAHSPENGARALRRRLQHSLVEPLAEWISGLGADARHGELRVALLKDRALNDPASTGPEPVDGEGEKLGAEIQLLRHEAAPWIFELRRRPQKRRGADENGLRSLQARRRVIRDVLDGPRLSALRDQLQLLEQQMHQANRTSSKRKASNRTSSSRKRRRDVDMAGLGRSYHRLSAAWKPVDGLRTELEELEELGLSSLLAGESVDLWTEGLWDFDRRWAAALPAALLATEPRRDRLVLLVEEPDKNRGLDVWLPGLVAKARELGWQLTAHTAAGKSRSEKAYEGDDLLQRVADPERGFRALVLQVAGPDAGRLLAVEAGLHRFIDVGPFTNLTAYLRVRRVAFRALDDKILDGLSSLDLGVPFPSRQLGAEPADRVLRFSQGTVEVCGHDTSLKPEDYWSGFDLVLCRVLLRFEEDEALDRDQELGSQMLAGVEPDEDGALEEALP